MLDYFKPKTWLITALILAVSFSISLAIVYYEFGFKQSIKITSAGLSDNVNGWAWNSIVGWISFNCTNDSPACSSSNYGVNINLNNGHFNGYAWSDGLGWISFNENDAPSYTFNGNCFTPGSCGAASNCTACYNINDQKVYGWAKILSLGNNGWIKLRKDPSDTGGDYGVTISPATGDFSGWAWNANDSSDDGIGWISFNCSNESPACSGTNYKVSGKVNRSPAATNLTAPNWNYTNAAGALGALNAKIGWTFSDQDIGSSESAYQIIVNTQNSTSNPLFDSGKCLDINNPTSKCKSGHGPTGSTYFSLNAADGLGYNTAYYWWVKVWDNYDEASALAQYNTIPDTDNDNGAVLTFTTYKHEFPDVSATWFPNKPNQEEEVKFTDTSSIYQTASPALAVPCDSSKCVWLWTIPAGDTIDDQATSTPTVVFNSTGSKVVKLQVTDVDGYKTEISMLVDVNAKLPRWEEVKPK